MQAVRAPWTSASFLLYAGGLTIFVATLRAARRRSGATTATRGFVGWSALVLAVLVDLRLRFPGWAAADLPAGLFALSTVVALAVFVGALEEWAGWLAHTDSPFAGFHLDHFAIELTLLAGAVAARTVFRFPLLVLLATGAAWFFVTDLLSNGGNWSAVMTLFSASSHAGRARGRPHLRVLGAGGRRDDDRRCAPHVLALERLRLDLDRDRLCRSTSCSAPGSGGRVTRCSVRLGSFSSRRTSSSNGLSRSTSPSSARSRRAPAVGRRALVRRLRARADVDRRVDRAPPRCGRPRLAATTISP